MVDLVNGVWVWVVGCEDGVRRCRGGSKLRGESGDPRGSANEGFPCSSGKPSRSETAPAAWAEKSTCF